MDAIVEARALIADAALLEADAVLRALVAEIDRLRVIEAAAREMAAAIDDWNRAHGAVEATQASIRQQAAKSALIAALKDGAR